jgi:imidazolonepropionase
MRTDLLIRNIKCLVQTEDEPVLRVSGQDMSELTVIPDAFLYIRNGLIDDFGTMKSLENTGILNNDFETFDAKGKFVFPSFCDSHTHLVYSGSREMEYIDKIRGLSYAEIAKRGGGILNSAKKLHDTTEDELYQQALRRVNEIISLGTGAVEIKSGYGLNL